MNLRTKRMRLLLQAVIPLVTFGPLLATGIGGVLLDEPSWALKRLVPILGAFMTSGGIIIVAGALRAQAHELSRLRDEVRRLAGR
jgi:uncharacterized membrane protein HdeD (DUF308 family)